MPRPIRLLSIFGTRPEAIKLAPVIRAFQRCPHVESRVCITSQHRQMLDQVMALFGMDADWDLDIMSTDQSLAAVTTRVLSGVDEVLSAYRPDWVVVQGDTTTCFAGALAALYHQVPVLHIEAGLRSGDILSPWPEEANRQMTGRIAKVHCAPTPGAACNLRKEGIHDDAIFVTGNTVIDALFLARDKIASNAAIGCRGAGIDQVEGRRLILVTGHRRENFGAGLREVCEALQALAQRDDVYIVYAVHLNPRVREPVNALLGSCKNVRLVEPLDYGQFLQLMDQAYLVITDSGGIQEEAPALGKPVLVTRDTTERPEAVDAGTVILTGPRKQRLLHEATRLLECRAHYDAMARAHNPYGDGHASARILDYLLALEGLGERPAPWSGVAGVQAGLR